MVKRVQFFFSKAAQFVTQFNLTDEEFSAIKQWGVSAQVLEGLAKGLRKIPSYDGPCIRDTDLNEGTLAGLATALSTNSTMRVMDLVKSIL
jgi:hypothetical protein